MISISREDLDFLISMARCLIEDGMVNFTYEDVVKLEEIEKKWEEKR